MSRRFRLAKSASLGKGCASAANGAQTFAGVSSPQLPKNPYRRFFTRQRTFDDLTRPPQAPAPLPDTAARSQSK